MLTLTITEKISARNIRYVLECDGVRTHMLNSNSMDWHLEHKLQLNAAQRNEVFHEIANHGSATLQLTPVQALEQAAS